MLFKRGSHPSAISGRQSEPLGCGCSGRVLGVRRISPRSILLLEGFLCLIGGTCTGGALSLCSFKGRDTSQVLRGSEDRPGALETRAALQACPSESLGRTVGISFFFKAPQEILILMSGQGEDKLGKGSRGEGGAFEGWPDKTQISSFPKDPGHGAPLWEARGI